MKKNGLKNVYKIPNWIIGCKVAGKRVDRRAGYEIEISVQYRYIGTEEAVEWKENNNSTKKFLRT